jgi:hypothetical protein
MYKHGYYNDLVSICRKAITIEKLDDFIHYYYIKGLFETGDKSTAKSHYAYVMDLFYNKHGINPSPEFVSLYEQTVKDDRSYNVNFGILKGQLDDAGDDTGAFYCEFPFFKHVYQLEVRDAIRNDRPTHLCLITAVSKNQEELEPKSLNRVTGKLADCIKGSLRSRDVYSRYSASQFVMLLTNTSKEQAEMVLNRLTSDAFQDSVRGVIYAENQFRSVSYLEDAEPTSIQYEAVERALEGPNVLPEDVYYFATYPVNGNIWGKIGGHIFCYE